MTRLSPRRLRDLNCETQHPVNRHSSLWPAVNALLLPIVLMASCATPVAPSGGPTDDVPPQLEQMLPEPNSVEVDTREIKLVFAEYINEGSLAQAFSITPEPPGRLQISWKRKTATVRFDEPLRDSTTFIITIDTKLSDANNVRLKTPIVRAFATGSQIDRASIVGRVVDARDGAGVSSTDIFAYAATDSVLDRLPALPDYRSQSDESGRFRLEYLRAGLYYVIGVADGNGNRQPDPSEAVAIAANPYHQATETAALIEPLFLYAVLDTIPPQVRRVAAVSDQRVNIRFSESVVLTASDSSAWSLFDSTGTPVPVFGAYATPDESREITLRTATMRPIGHMLFGSAVADSAGNAAVIDSVSFRSPARPDTMRTRFRGFFPTTDDAQGVTTFRPGEPFGTLFNQYVPFDSLQRFVRVVNSEGTNLSYTSSTLTGTDARIVLPAQVITGELTVSVDGSALGAGDTTFVQTFRQERPAQLGELGGQVAAPGIAARNAVVELYSAGQRRTPLEVVRVDTSGKFIFANLRDGRYRLRAYLDQDLDTRWDPGSVSPFTAYEPILWISDTLRVRPRWETILEDTLRFTLPRATTEE